MQVDIITFHFVPNQGAVLQCCALKLFLEKKGHSVAVIDYRPQYHTVRYSKHRNPFIYAEWYWKKYKKSSLLNKTRIYCQSFLRAICLNIKKSENKTLDAFEVFVSRHIPLTTRYTSLKQLQDNPPIADAYVGGSDQLWNPELLDQEFDQAYFLNFGKDTTARVSYAVSMGKIQDSNYLKELNWYCKPLTAVSLREYNAETIEAIGRDVHICIDPTLLLDDNDYEPMESNNIESKPYIFVYGFEDTNEIHEAIGMAQNRYNCEIINGSPHRIMYENSRKIRDFGPDRFLSFIKNAQCVVTNSFHGSAFSIIYR